MIKEVEAHGARSHCTLTRKSDLNNKHKNKDRNLKTILLIYYFKRKRLLDGILMKQKSILCSHVGMKKWGVNYY